MSRRIHAVAAALMVALLAPRAALADVYVTEPVDGVIDGLVWRRTGGDVAGAEVRIVGDVTVIVAHADAHGRVRVVGLPAGRYRVEVGDARIAIPPPPPVTLADEPFTCVLPLPDRRFGATLATPVATMTAPVPRTRPLARRRGHVDTTRTAVGITLGSRDLVGR